MTQEVTSISCKDTWEMVQSNPRAVLIDIRSNMEFLFIGHPVGAINIPWIDEPDWKINPNFAKQIRKVVLGGICSESTDGCVPVILICRSGKRSLEAGALLLKEDFNEVFNVLGGFEGDLDESHHRSSINGWRHDELPWEQC